MKNLFPTIESVIQYTKPLYTIQLLTIKVNGVMFQVMYIQDIHSFKIAYYDVYNHPVNSEAVYTSVCSFVKTLTNIVYSDITFVMLKTSPLSNQQFINYMNELNVNSSYFGRMNELQTYQSHKVYLKRSIINEPNNISGVIKNWNDLSYQTISNII